MNDQKIDKLAVALTRKRALTLIGAGALALLFPNTDSSAEARPNKRRRRGKKRKHTGLANSGTPATSVPISPPDPPNPGPPGPPVPPANVFFCPPGSRSACGTGQNVMPPSCFCNLDYQGQSVCTGERTSTPCVSHADCGPGQFCAQRRVDLQPGTSENICAYRCEVRGGFFPF